MADTHFTEIVVVLDRSGSMSSIQEDMVGGFRAFVDAQRKVAGRCQMSLFQFDNEFESVFEGRALSEVGELVLEPRGSTALLDAVGRSIQLTGERLRQMPEAERPGNVIVLVITDGHENASCEWTVSLVRQKIEHQRDKYSWQFAFLGADMDAWGVAQHLGMNVNSVQSFGANPRSVARMYNAVGSAVAAYRSARVSTDACVVQEASLNIAAIAEDEPEPAAPPQSPSTQSPAKPPKKPRAR